MDGRVDEAGVQPNEPGAAAGSTAQQCPNCPGAAFRPLFEIGPGNSVVRCKRCGLQYAQRYPRLAAASASLYSEGYFEAAIQHAESRARIFAELLQEIERVLGRRGRLLDVGAGEGALLAEAQRLGWTAEGTEISAAMVERVRRQLGLVIHHGELESLSMAGRFDAIVMNHVLEHLRNPTAALEHAAALLSADGIIRVEVPNLAGLSSRGKNFQSRLHLKRHPWKHYSVGHHFWFFTPPTLRRTLESAGLTVLEMRAPAKQWGHRGLGARLWSDLCNRALCGGHLVAYANLATRKAGREIRPSAT